MSAIEEEIDYAPPKAPPPHAPVEVDPAQLLDVDTVMQTTQALRLRIINNLTQNATGMPLDTKQEATLLKAIDGMDKAVATKRRLGIEEQAAKTGEEEARNTASILRELKGKMFAQANVVDPNRPAPALGSEVPEPILKPGETEIGTANMNYETFTKGAGQDS